MIDQATLKRYRDNRKAKVASDPLAAMLHRLACLRTCHDRSITHRTKAKLSAEIAQLKNDIQQERIRRSDYQPASAEMKGEKAK